MFEIWSDLGFEGSNPQEASADSVAHGFSKKYAGHPFEVRNPDGKVIARHFGGKRIIPKVAGFSSGSTEPEYVAVPYQPRPAAKVGFGLAA